MEEIFWERRKVGGGGGGGGGWKGEDKRVCHVDVERQLHLQRRPENQRGEDVDVQ